MKTRKKGLWVLPLAALLAGIFFLSFLIGRYRVPALQVLRLQDRGLTRSEIARQLQLSERSVKYQCEQAYHKLGTSNKVEALAAARKLNLLN